MFSHKLALLSLCLAVIPRARSAVFNVTVGGPGVLAYTPNQVNANIGDVINFVFNVKNHTVTQSTLASPCSPLEGGFDSGFVPVSATETDLPLAQLEVKSMDPIWVYCRQAGHCQAGMVFAVNPGNNFAAFQAAATGSAPSATAAPSGAVTVTTTVTVSGAPVATTYTTSAPSAVPTTSSDHVIEVGGTAGLVFTPANITAQPGDTVTFKFLNKNHTATMSSFANPCRALSETSTTGQLGFDSGFMPVPQNATDFPTFTIQVNDTNPIWGYCRQTNPVDHCGSGMVFSVNAVESGANNFAAFQTKAIQLNGTASSAAPASPTGATETSSNGAAAAHSARSAGAAVLALAGVVAGLLL